MIDELVGLSDKLREANVNYKRAAAERARLETLLADAQNQEDQLYNVLGDALVEVQRKATSTQAPPGPPKKD